MATKKKSKKKSTKSKRPTSRKARTLARKKTAPKKPAKRKVASSKAVETKKASDKRTIRRKIARPGARRTGQKSQAWNVSGFSREESGARSGERSGDLQGLSNVEGADSESVDELIEEGNPFEAGVVSGVEEAGDRGEKEVRTHEVPEDDVPSEYLDEE